MKQVVSDALYLRYELTRAVEKLRATNGGERELADLLALLNEFTDRYGGQEK